MLSKSDERTWATSNIVKCELGDTRVKLHQQGERLADTSTGSKNCDLSQLKAPRCQYVFYKGCSERWGLFFTCLAEAEKARRCTELKACLAANMMTDAEERLWAGKGRFERVNGLVMNLFSGEVAALGVCRRLVRGRVESFLSAPPMKSKEVALVLLLRSLGVHVLNKENTQQYSKGVQELYSISLRPLSATTVHLLLIIITRATCPSTC